LTVLSERNLPGIIRSIIPFSHHPGWLPQLRDCSCAFLQGDNIQAALPFLGEHARLPDPKFRQAHSTALDG